MNSTSRTALQAIGTGLAGAAAATIASRAARRTTLGSTRQLNFNRPLRGSSLGLGMAGALLSNSLLYGLAGPKGDKRNWLRGALLGLGAGLGAMTIPKQKRSFWFRPARRTGKAKLLTIGQYLAGGLAAAAASRLIGRVPLRKQRHNLFD